MSEYREIIVKEYHNEKGLITRREVGEEVVRCKDCVKRHDGCPMQVWCGTDDNDFCSRGEKYDIDTVGTEDEKESSADH